MLGKEHPDYVVSLFNLAKLYQVEGKYSKSKSLHTEALSIREKILGTSHPDYASSLQSLAELYKVMGKPEKSEPLFSELAQLNHSLLSRSVRHLSTRELENYTQTFNASKDQVLSFVQLPANRNSPLLQTCYDNALFYKGFLLDATQQVKRLALSDSTTTARFNLLKSYERRLAKEYDKPKAERDTSGIAELEEKANTLEKDLARTVAGYGEAMRQVKWQEVQESLKEGEAAIEFVHYRYYGKEKTDSIQYAVLLLLPGGKPLVFIPLFEEKQLEWLIPGSHLPTPDFVKALYTPDLYRLVWQPLETHLGGINNVYFSPSGLLHRISFPALPTPLEGGKGGDLLADRYNLQYMSSTRNLLFRNKTEQSRPATALVYGGIDYEPEDSIRLLVEKTDSLANTQPEAVAQKTVEPEKEEMAISSSGTKEGKGLRGIPYPIQKELEQNPKLKERKWGQLDTTLVELQRLEQFFKSQHIFTMTLQGQEASEESFKAAGVHFPSPDILHISTHGFFFSDIPDKTASFGTGADNLRYSENPLRRSGIVLAGANLAWSRGFTLNDRQDGILTAEEISLQNLSGTKLVVLSACETGLGDIRGSEGVYGLQRAFKMAGADYLLLTLWKIPDSEETVNFMEVFYEKWLKEGMPIREAFNATQQEIRGQGKDAYYWAGFVLVD